MDILIRDVEPKFIAEIDRRCKDLKEQRGTIQSRNDYLKNMIKEDFNRPLTEYKIEKMDQFLTTFERVQSHNTRVLEEYIDSVNQLIQGFITENTGGI